MWEGASRVWTHSPTKIVYLPRGDHMHLRNLLTEPNIVKQMVLKNCFQRYLVAFDAIKPPQLLSSPQGGELCPIANPSSLISSSGLRSRYMSNDSHLWISSSINLHSCILASFLVFKVSFLKTSWLSITEDMFGCIIMDEGQLYRRQHIYLC